MEKFTIGDEVMVMRRKCNTEIGKTLVRKIGIVQMLTVQRYRDDTTEYIACIEFPGKFQIVPLLQKELKITKYKYMNNTPRPTTVKQDITKFLLENDNVVNPLVIAKAIRRKLSTVRRELNKMILNGDIVATYDKKKYYTSIKLPSKETSEPTLESIPESVFSDRATLEENYQCGRATDEEMAKFNSGYPIACTQEEIDSEKEFNESLAYKPEIIIDALHDSVEALHASGEDFYRTPSGLVPATTHTPNKSFWSKIKSLFS